MAVNKSRLTIGKDTRGVRDKTSRKSTGGLLGLDPDGDSVVSFQALDARPAIKFAWAAGNDKVGLLLVEKASLNNRSQRLGFPCFLMPGQLRHVSPDGGGVQ
jgi:hypothetical protein